MTRIITYKKRFAAFSFAKFKKHIYIATDKRTPEEAFKSIGGKLPKDGKKD